MSVRDLFDAECGSANPLMRLGGQVIQDAARKDDGLSGASSSAAFFNRSNAGALSEQQLVHEFHQQIAPAPTTFHMDPLLKEMQQIESQHFQPNVMCAPTVIDEINNSNAASWANEFSTHGGTVAGTNEYADKMAIKQMNDQIWNESQSTRSFELASRSRPTSHLIKQHSFPVTSEIFDAEERKTAVRRASQIHHRSSITSEPDQSRYTEFMKFMNRNNSFDQAQPSVWADEFSYIDHKLTAGVNEVDWLKEFEESKKVESQKTETANNDFWNQLQDSWNKISEKQEFEHPWLSEYTEIDPYKEYQFDEENPMLNTENAFEKGKAFLMHGDIPSAVLCFEAAVQNDMENADIWQLLGTSQAENEKDPNAIAALKKSLQYKPNNPDVFMALSISYTNESLQNKALQMLIEWLRCNPKYQNIVPENFHNDVDAAVASSLVQDFDLKEVQGLYLKAVQQDPTVIDPEIQEALGVLFNLSSEYDKAADCFRTALSVKSKSAKLWNRLGASLANGNRSVDAVEAYQNALNIEPGYIRARYNVGIICINLKAYKEAIEHFLTALNHQATSMQRSGLNNPNPNNQMSDAIWSTLRMAVALLGKGELQGAVDRRDLSELNEAFKTVDD